jgi:hypothetical protein
VTSFAFGVIIRRRLPRQIVLADDRRLGHRPNKGRTGDAEQEARRASTLMSNGYECVFRQHVAKNEVLEQQSRRENIIKFSTNDQETFATDHGWNVIHSGHQAK